MSEIPKKFRLLPSRTSADREDAVGNLNLMVEWIKRLIKDHIRVMPPLTIRRGTNGIVIGTEPQQASQQVLFAELTTELASANVAEIVILKWSPPDGWTPTEKTGTIQRALPHPAGLRFPIGTRLFVWQVAANLYAPLAIACQDADDDEEQPIDEDDE